MKIKTSELKRDALNWAVAVANGTVPRWQVGFVTLSPIIKLIDWDTAEPFEPSSDWSQGGPIIEREEIYLRPTGDSAAWESYVWGRHPQDGIEQFIHRHYGPTPLIAAMRCYVESKLGDEVDVPQELL